MKDIHLRELTSGSFTAFSAQLLSLFLKYIIYFLIAQYYGSRGVGIYEISIVALFIAKMFGTLGMDTAVLRFAGQYQAENTLYKLRMLFPMIQRTLLLVLLLIAGAIYFFSDFIAVHLLKEPFLSHTLKMMAFILPFFALDTVNVELIRGLKNIRLSEYLRDVNKALIIVFLFITIHSFVQDDLLPVFIFSIATVVNFLISTAYVHNRLKSLTRKTADIISRRELLRISVPMMLTVMAFLLMGRVDTIMISILGSMEEVGTYSITFKLALVLTVFLTAVNKIAAPKISECYWTDDRDNLQKIIRWCSKILFWTTLPVAFILMTFSGHLLRIFGPDFMAGRSALFILTFGQFINCILGPVGYTLNMTGKQNVLRNIVIGALLINVCLNMILIPRYGINGAAFATMVSMCFWNISGSLYLLKKEKIRTLYLPFLGKYSLEKGSN